MTGSERRRIYDTSTDPARGGFRRDVASALGLLVILFNLVAGTLVASTSSSGAAPFLEESLGNRIVICTGAGMIVLDAEGNPVHRDGGVDAMCVFCLPMMAGNADAPTTVDVLETPAVADRSEPGLTVVETTVAPAPVVSSTSPRGPPRV